MIGLEKCVEGIQYGRPMVSKMEFPDHKRSHFVSVKVVIPTITTTTNTSLPARRRLWYAPSIVAGALQQLFFTLYITTDIRNRFFQGGVILLKREGAVECCENVGRRCSPGKMVDDEGEMLFCE